MISHLGVSHKKVGSAVRENLSPLSQQEYDTYLFTGEYCPNVATWPARYTDLGWDSQRGSGLHSPSSWLQGSWLVAKDTARTLPQAGPMLDAVSGYSDTSDRIHNSPPLTPKQLSVQEVPQKEVFKPAGFQRSAEIWYTKQMSLQRIFGFACKIQIS